MPAKQMTYSEALRRVQAAKLGGTYYDEELRRAIEIVCAHPERQPDDKEPELRGRRQ